MNDCLACQRIEQIKRHANRYFVAELESGFVVLSDNQFYKGYTLLLAKTHATELHELTSNTRQQFLNDMARTAQAVHDAFQPRKLNYELLGNTIPHLHWHIIPRHNDDPLPEKAVWEYSREKRLDPQFIPGDEELTDLKGRLRSCLIKG